MESNKNNTVYIYIYAKNSNENTQGKKSNKQPSPGRDKTQDGESNLRQMDDLPRVDAGYRSTREARQCLSASGNPAGPVMGLRCAGCYRH